MLLDGYFPNSYPATQMLQIQQPLQEKTAPIKLDTSANNFERGAKDLFKLRAIDVGDLQAVVVRKDNSGLLGSDWHLQSVEVWHPALKKRYFFICNDWLKVGKACDCVYVPRTGKGLGVAVCAVERREGYVGSLGTGSGSCAAPGAGTELE